jgi:hypothetical protein
MKDPAEGGVKSNCHFKQFYGKGLRATSVTPHRSGLVSRVTCTGIPSTLAFRSISAILSTLAKQVELAELLPFPFPIEQELI